MQRSGLSWTISKQKTYQILYEKGHLPRGKRPFLVLKTQWLLLELERHRMGLYVSSRMAMPS